MTEDCYQIAGTDLRDYVDSLLIEIAGLNSANSSLLQLIDAQDEPDRAFLGAVFVMEQIAPRLWGGDRSRDLLLLFAVVEVYGLEGHGPWRGCADHLRRAFDYSTGLGEEEIARRLRQSFVDGATDREARVAMQMLTRPTPDSGPVPSGGHRGRPVGLSRQLGRSRPARQWLLSAADLLDPQRCGCTYRSSV